MREIPIANGTTEGLGRSTEGTGGGWGVPCVELLPFLFVRSGRPLVELLTWGATIKGPDWIDSVLQILPMAAERIHAEVSAWLADPRRLLR